MKSVRFHPEAEIELAAEALYYDEQSPGLGQRFARDVEAAVALASEFPRIGSPHRYGTRRVFPKRFPFSIVYQELEEELVVLAIALMRSSSCIVCAVKYDSPQLGHDHKGMRSTASKFEPAPKLRVTCFKWTAALPQYEQAASAMPKCTALHSAERTRKTTH